MIAYGGSYSYKKTATRIIDVSNIGVEFWWSTDPNGSNVVFSGGDGMYYLCAKPVDRRFSTAIVGYVESSNKMIVKELNTNDNTIVYVLDTTGKPELSNFQFTGKYVFNPQMGQPVQANVNSDGTSCSSPNFTYLGWTCHVYDVYLDGKLVDGTELTAGKTYRFAIYADGTSVAAQRGDEQVILWGREPTSSRYNNSGGMYNLLTIQNDWVNSRYVREGNYDVWYISFKDNHIGDKIRIEGIIADTEHGTLYGCWDSREYTIVR